MDKNTIVGFVLIAIILIGWSWYTRPSEEELKAQQEQVEKEQAAQKQLEAKKKAEEAKKKAEQAEALKDSTAMFHNALSGTASDVVLKNEKLELTLSTKGGTVTKAVVKDFKDKDGKPDVTIFEGKDQNLDFSLEGKDMNISTSDLYFTPSEQTDSTVTFTADAGEGRSIMMTYRLGRNYMAYFTFKAVGMEGLFSPKTHAMNVTWHERCKQQEKGHEFENRYATLTYKEKGSGTDYLSETQEKSETLETPIDWVAFKSQFFSAMMIAKDEFSTGAKLKSVPQDKSTGYLKTYDAELETFFDPKGETATELEFFYGPNDFRLLQAVEKESHFGKDLKMERLVYLGWPLIRYINRFFTLYVFDWLTKLGLNMGIVLILITLLLKAITYPMVKKSYMSSAKMRVLRPKIEEATKQYDKPEDQMQKSQAQMQIYSQYGVSPLSGCLPMLIQMPIWIAMFNFVPNAIQLRGEKFLWIDDLSTYDPILQWDNPIWAIGDHLSLTCILFCVANILYSVMTMRQQRDQMVGEQAQQMKMMQWMMFLMPVFFFFMFNNYSAGLNFYYFISLFFSAAIMFILRKTTNDAKLLAILEARYEENKKNPKKKKGFAARLEAMQQQMQQQQEEMKRKREELERKQNELNKRIKK
ncbi:MAG: membrane protein insertase YidC [Prevotella sp.]|nr:membrane protein insertase YidC [Prevotella sp.]